MEIKAYVKDGYLAFKCDGIFTEPLEKVVLSKKTHLFKFIFKRSGDEVELDCPVDDEMIRAVAQQAICGLGFFYKERMLASSLVPLEVC